MSGRLRRRARLTAWGRVAVLVCLLGAVATCLVWRAQGGRWEVVETASMGTVAPVGTLLWVSPVPFSTLQPGDFITFRPPDQPDVTYSHRVFRVNPDRTLTTKGVIPAPDPWRLGPADVVGKVHAAWWGAGWLVMAAPVLLVGGGLIGLGRALVRADRRLPLTLILAAGVVSVALTAYRPLVNAQQLAFAPDPGGGATATYVSTGLLPVRLSAHDGASVVLHDGQVGSVRVDVPDDRHRLSVELGPSVPVWFWALLVGGCFLPAVGATAGSLRQRPARNGRLSC